MRQTTAVVAALLLVGACDKSPTQTTPEEPEPAEAAPKPSGFDCYKESRGQWRECSPAPGDLCDERGCFRRETAFCFRAKLFDDSAEQFICTPTARECEEWHADRQGVLNDALGPCVEARADEYIE